MSGRLQGKKALIYGGGTGIGLACAEAMAREGAAVYISGRRESVLREAMQDLKAHGKAGYTAGDATIAADVQRVTATAADFMGGIDTILVSAGAGGRTPIFDTPVEEFQRIIDHSLLPAFLAMRFGAEHLLASGAASVIVISSMYGLVGQKERAGYCAGKHGVIGLVKSAALDFAEKGVRVNAICPGFIETPLAIAVANQEPDPEATLRAKRLMHAIPRPGKLEEVGELAVYLASDLSAFMTGQAVAIDGGYSTR
ncbi:SDR family NAD(P)-dependent oxidoreductase [Dongia deserti]|uniref:SDR family NAD(P)-dependent oxidoreductase n=1 Tax=Dongia deserti TaxID=2268030 RepID=UPI0013C4D7AC|nr:SDR family oxidoreductase [Dongia deserti]